jgi:hypothetical protein
MIYLIIPRLIFGSKFWILQGTTAGIHWNIKTLESGLPVDVGGMNFKSIVDGVAQKVAQFDGIFLNFT